MKHSVIQYKHLLLQIIPASTLILVLIFFYGINVTLKAQNHLLLSEVTLQPAEAEFIEIFNPTDSVVLLDNYYLADNQAYPYVPGILPALDLGDFVIRFPQGASVNPKETIVVATDGSDFETYYAYKADFEIYDGDTNTPDMIIISENTATLANAGEGISLFYWNGSAAVVKDVDLMNVGIPTSSSQIVDKTNIPGYLPDTHTMPFQSQNGPPGNGYSTKRILFEGQYEIHMGGNGITGDDETSEDISITWDAVYTIPTPGSTELTGIGNRSVPDMGNTLQLYPNPASSEVNIIVNSQAIHYTIRIGNSQGIVLETQKHTNSFGKSIKINVSKFESGIYFVIYQSDNEMKVQKLMLFKNDL